MARSFSHSSRTSSSSCSCCVRLLLYSLVAFVCVGGLMLLVAVRDGVFHATTDEQYYWDFSY